MIENGREPFKREKVQKKADPVPPLRATWSQFNKRVTKTYDPSQTNKLEKLNRWDVNKKQLLDYMKCNRRVLSNRDDLVYNVDDIQRITNLSRRFPANKKYSSRPHKFVGLTGKVQSVVLSHAIKTNTFSLPVGSTSNQAPLKRAERAM